MSVEANIHNMKNRKGSIKGNNHMEPINKKILALLSAIVCLSGISHAATGTWLNTGSDFNDNSSWSDALTITSTLTFDAASPNAQPALSANISINALTFATGGWTLGGDYTLTINGVSTGAVGLKSSGINTIAANLILNRYSTDHSIQSVGVDNHLIITGNLTRTNRGEDQLSLGGGSASDWAKFTLSGSNTMTNILSLGNYTILNLNSTHAIGDANLSTSSNSSLFNNTSGADIVLAGIGGLRLANSAGNGTTFGGDNSLTFQGGLYIAGNNAQKITVSANTLAFNGMVTEDEIGNRGFTKQGVGTLIINGGGSHTGVTTVSAGTLLINGDWSSATTVAAVSTFGGSADLSAGLTLANNATLAFNIDSAGWDGLDLTGGTFAYGNNINLSINLASGVTGTFDLLDWSVLSGDYSSLTLDKFTYIDIPDGTFTVADGKLVLSVIPEPSTYVLLGLGIGLLAFLRRQRAKA
jgi:autotransporter-associated beta strand protein